MTSKRESRTGLGKQPHTNQKSKAAYGTAELTDEIWDLASSAGEISLGEEQREIAGTVLARYAAHVVDERPRGGPTPGQVTNQVKKLELALKKTSNAMACLAQEDELGEALQTSRTLQDLWVFRCRRGRA